MKKGGTAVWKTQVWIMLFIIIILLSILVVKTLTEKRQNYQELWNKVAEIERKCQ